MVALVETVGVTALGQVFQYAQQGRVEVSSGQGIVYSLPVDLSGAGDIIMRFGAAFDFQAVHTDVNQSLDMLHRTQIFRIHDVSAVFVFHHGQQFSKPVFFFQ